MGIHFGEALHHTSQGNYSSSLACGRIKPSNFPSRKSDRRETSMLEQGAKKYRTRVTNSANDRFSSD